MDSSQSNVLQLKQKFAGTEFDFEPNTPNLAIQQVKWYRYTIE